MKQRFVTKRNCHPRSEEALDLDVYRTARGSRTTSRVGLGIKVHGPRPQRLKHRSLSACEAT